MRNQIGIIVNALDAEAEAQQGQGLVMGTRLHAVLSSIAGRIQKAEADFTRLHPSGQHVETRSAALTYRSLPVEEVSRLLAAAIKERDDAIRQLDDAKKTVRDMLKAREDRIAFLEAECQRQGATIKEQDKKVAALESEMQDAAGLRAALDAARNDIDAHLTTINFLRGSTLPAAAARAEGAEKALATERARVTALRAENADLRRERLEAPTDAALKALAADTLDIVRTFHNEGAQPGESLARYVARNVETLRAALRTVMVPLTLLTHHRGQFRPEDGLLDRLAKLAQRPQS